MVDRAGVVVSSLAKLEGGWSQLVAKYFRWFWILIPSKCHGTQSKARIWPLGKLHIFLGKCPQYQRHPTEKIELNQKFKVTGVLNLIWVPQASGHGPGGTRSPGDFCNDYDDHVRISEAHNFLPLMSREHSMLNKIRMSGHVGILQDVEIVVLFGAELCCFAPTGVSCIDSIELCWSELLLWQCGLGLSEKAERRWTRTIQ